MTNREIEKTAAEVYTQYVRRGGSFKKMEEIMQAENIKFREVPSANADFVGVLTRGNNDQIYIMVNQGIDNFGRRNFTIAHELGHHFLKHQMHSGAFFCCNDEITEEELAADSIECEANYFSDCFLMPEDKITGAFHAILRNSQKIKIEDHFCVRNDYTFSIWCGIKADLMKRYGVSEAALRYRLKELSLVKFEFQGGKGISRYKR